MGAGAGAGAGAAGAAEKEQEVNEKEELAWLTCHGNQGESLKEQQVLLAYEGRERPHARQPTQLGKKQEVHEKEELAWLTCEGNQGESLREQGVLLAYEGRERPQATQFPQSTQSTQAIQAKERDRKHEDHTSLGEANDRPPGTLRIRTLGGTKSEDPTQTSECQSSHLMTLIYSIHVRILQHLIAYKMQKGDRTQTGSDKLLDGNGMYNIQVSMLRQLTDS